jgi:hypothetical protein
MLMIHLHGRGTLSALILTIVSVGLHGQAPAMPQARTLGAPTVLSTMPVTAYPTPQIMEAANGDLLVSLAGRITVLDSALRVKRTLLDAATAPTAGPTAAAARRVTLKMIRYQGDSIAVFDGSPAATVFGPELEGSRTMAFGRVRDVTRLTPSPATRVDRQGRVVYLGLSSPGPAAVIAPSPAPTALSDTAIVVAYDQHARTLDTIGFVKTNSLVRSTTSREPGKMIMTTVLAPFSQDDQWGVLSDGTIMIVRSIGCVVDIATAAGLRRAPRPIPCERRRLSEADKDSIWKAQDAVATSMRSSAAGATASIGGRSPTTIEIRYSAAPPAEYPDFVPAYQEAMPDDDGHLWLLRGARGSETGMSYDVVDKTGALVDRVTLPPRATLLGFGKRGIYVLMQANIVLPQANTGGGSVIGRISK